MPSSHGPGRGGGSSTSSPPGAAAAGSDTAPSAAAARPSAPWPPPHPAFPAQVGQGLWGRRAPPDFRLRHWSSLVTAAPHTGRAWPISGCATRRQAPRDVGGAGEGSGPPDPGGPRSLGSRGGRPPRNVLPASGLLLRPRPPPSASPSSARRPSPGSSCRLLRPHLHRPSSRALPARASLPAAAAPHSGERGLGRGCGERRGGGRYSKVLWLGLLRKQGQARTAPVALGAGRDPGQRTALGGGGACVPGRQRQGLVPLAECWPRPVPAPSWRPPVPSFPQNASPVPHPRPGTARAPVPRSGQWGQSLLPQTPPPEPSPRAGMPCRRGRRGRREGLPRGRRAARQRMCPVSPVWGGVGGSPWAPVGLSELIPPRVCAGSVAGRPVVQPFRNSWSVVSWCLSGPAGGSLREVPSHGRGFPPLQTRGAQRWIPRLLR